MKGQTTGAITRSHDSTRFDVAIIGCGFEGGVLGTILARHGYKVLMVDESSHPRFVLGESTVRHVWRTMKIMAERYDIPEFRDKLNSGAAVHKYVTSSCGIKKNFGFVYHREGEHQRPEEATQLVIPPAGEGYEAHLYRQDIDSFLVHTAAHYGAKIRYNTPIAHVEVDDGGVTLKSSKGDTFMARFVADASGPGSLLSRLWGLRDDPPRIRTNTRCVFSHMIDVTPYDDLELPNGVPRMPERWYSGTCHHIFDGGWLWVIPFDNREGSTNTVCSIGLNLDNVKFPKPENKTAEEEWNEFLGRYPSIREQFKNAKAVREWVATGRLQKTLSRGVGDRWVVMSAAHGSGFLDAVFSRGLANASEMINALAGRLMKALDDDDLRAERFEYIERLMQAHLARNDELVYGTYLSFRAFDLWNAWYRIWAIGVGLGDLKLAHIYHTYLKARDESVLPDAEEPLGLFCSNYPPYGDLLARSFAEMLKFEAGKQTAQEASDRIFKLLGDIRFVSPAIGLADPAQKCINVGKPAIALRSLMWAMTQAPPEIKQMTLSAMRVMLPRGMQTWKLSRS
ncbi:MAG: tryptophan 7-halogenase [Candidatus Rokubacteria bacterium]|nr:tryptophan 7-halogenase [Candidatus Rokubacteria bacterium]